MKTLEVLGSLKRYAMHLKRAYYHQDYHTSDENMTVPSTLDSICDWADEEILRLEEEDKYKRYAPFV